MERRQRRDGVVAHGGPGTTLEIFHVEVAHHLDAPGDAIPRGRMHAGSGEGREDPDQIIGYEEMWTSGPALHVAVEVLKVLHPLLAVDLVPVCERRQSC